MHTDDKEASRVLEKYENYLDESEKNSLKSGVRDTKYVDEAVLNEFNRKKRNSLLWGCIFTIEIFYFLCTLYMLSGRNKISSTPFENYLSFSIYTYTITVKIMLTKYLYHDERNKDGDDVFGDHELFTLEGKIHNNVLVGEASNDILIGGKGDMWDLGDGRDTVTNSIRLINRSFLTKQSFLCS